MFPLAPWRRDALRTNLWFVPMIEVLGAIVLFGITHALDQQAHPGGLVLPSWMDFGTADAARRILTALAAAVITVVGIVFSITIVTLTLASTQFGPRMLRNFIRDRGTQYTLGTFVATFVYAMLVLISIGAGTELRPASVDHGLGGARRCLDSRCSSTSSTTSATSIQLPNVIASIAGDLSRAIDAEFATATASTFEAVRRPDDPAHADARRPAGSCSHRRAATFSSSATTCSCGSRAGGALIQLLHRPGHFLVARAAHRDRLAARRPRRGHRGVPSTRTSPVRTARSPRTSRSRSISSSRSRSARSLRRSTTRSPR